MPDYKKGKVYALRAPDTDEVYIGSTCQVLSKRIVQHRNDYKKGADNTSKRMMARKGVYIELIEEFPCDNKEQLNRREGEIMRQHSTRVNKFVSGLTAVERLIEENNKMRNPSKN